MFTKSLLPAVALTLACAYATIVQSQTIFTYNNKPVSKNEFLKAFNKNPDTTGDHAQKLREYLNMYINFKLKLQEAYSEKLDTKDEFRDEAQNFKNQLAENYINSQANIGGLVHEAFVRSQKDILLAEVFVAAPAAGGDTTPALQKIQEALAALKAGKRFEDVAATFSTDEYIKVQKGSMGYITAFTLPYEVENIVYALKPGEYSGIYRSGAGYHIFKAVAERPAAGKRKIQQILLPVAKGFTDADNRAVARKADSLYALVKNGGFFEEQAAKYAGPNMGSRSGGITIGVGTYNPAFEEEVYALQKPGDITKPFLNEYGYNIIKLLEIVPAAGKENDVVTQANLQQLVQGGDRLALAKSNLVKQWLAVTKYRKGQYNEADLWKYTDSAVTKHIKQYKAIDSATVLFSFPGKLITAADWTDYVRSVKQLGGAQARKAYTALLNDFTNQRCSEYYRNHIEEYNTAIADQMIEFNEANLLFAVMDKHVWAKASQDTVALRQYYTAHQQAYTWAPGVSALTVTAATKDIIDSISQKVKTAPAMWRKITAAYANIVNADSSRYENGQLPIKQNVPMQPGFACIPEKSQSGDGWVFVYVFNVYPQQSQRSFEDAKGMVINDYQQVLENEWLETLKKKYPVTINEKVLNGLK